MRVKAAITRPYGNLQKYQSRNIIQQVLIERFLNTVSGLVNGLAVRTLLDVGCAEGFALNHILRRSSLPLSALGVDIDSEALERGRALHPTLPFQVADIYHLPFGNRSFDLVLCLQVLEHLSSPEEALSELLRVSRAFCLLSVPHEPFFRLANLLRGKNIRRLGNDVEHLHNWSKGSFLRLMHPYLEIIAVKTSFPWLIVLGSQKTLENPPPGRPPRT